MLVKIAAMAPLTIFLNGETREVPHLTEPEHPVVEGGDAGELARWHLHRGVMQSNGGHQPAETSSAWAASQRVSSSVK